MKQAALPSLSIREEAWSESDSIGVVPIWSLLCGHGWADAAGDGAAVKL